MVFLLGGGWRRDGQRQREANGRGRLAAKGTLAVEAEVGQRERWGR